MSFLVPCLGDMPTQQVFSKEENSEYHEYIHESEAKISQHPLPPSRAGWEPAKQLPFAGLPPLPIPLVSCIVEAEHRAAPAGDQGAYCTLSAL